MQKDSEGKKQGGDLQHIVKAMQTRSVIGKQAYSYNAKSKVDSKNKINMQNLQANDSLHSLSNSRKHTYMPKIGKVKRHNERASPIMLHEKSLMEHNARTLDESTRNFLKTEGPAIAAKHMPNVVVKHNTELEVTEDLQQ